MRDTLKRRLYLLGACTAAALVLLVALDPLRLGIAGVDPSFSAKRVPQPSPSQMRSPRDADSRLESAAKWDVGGAIGPESVAFDGCGNGPYTGVADGRILKWEDGEWTEFAQTSPNRTNAMCRPGQPMANMLHNEHICGRPLGLRFSENGDLYVADAYRGLLKVGQEGGQAKCLVREVDGTPITFTNDLDVASDGYIYFTDSSSKYERRNFLLLVLSGDDSGRVIRYNPKNGKADVLLSGLQFPNGVALSQDESFLAIAESAPGRLLRHWLKGPRKGETDVMTNLPGYPDNVRVNERGEFWVAMHSRRNFASILSGVLPWLRRAFLQLPISFKHIYYLFNGVPPHGILAKYDSTGKFVDILEDKSGDVVKYASEVDEHEGKLWIGSAIIPHMAVYDLPDKGGND